MVDFDKTEVETLKRELNKVQCWITGYHAGAGHKANMLGVGIPGEDSVRQAQIFLGDLLRSLDEAVATAKLEEKVSDEESWVLHDGSGMPVDGDTRVTIKCRDGYIDGPARADYFTGENDWWDFKKCLDAGDEIVQYMVFR